MMGGVRDYPPTGHTLLYFSEPRKLAEISPHPENLANEITTIQAFKCWYDRQQARDKTIITMLIQGHSKAEIGRKLHINRGILRGIIKGLRKTIDWL